MTRDSLLLTIGVISAIFAYLTAAPIPTTWDYYEVIKFGSFLVGIGLAKLQTSPLKGQGE